MGANTVRIYGWLTENDHSEFLDALDYHGLKLMATFYMGDSGESPVGTPDERSVAIKKFVDQVEQYKDHSALLFWSFGNELNGVWNKYLQQLGKTDVNPCAWDERYDDLGGCWIHKGKVSDFPPGSACYESSYCVYSRLFSFINDAAK